MTISFRVISKKEVFGGEKNLVELTPGNWDDYNFKTTFAVSYYNADGDFAILGTVKIGCIDQTFGWTMNELPKEFESLPENFFSLGQDVDYYDQICKHLELDQKTNFLRAMQDVVLDDAHFDRAKNHAVFINSLMRGVSFSVIKDQYKRVLNGLPMLTGFKFNYQTAGDEQHAAINLNFMVEPSSTPSSNIHVLIGRNGVGKTTLMNNMVGAILGSTSSGRFSSAANCEGVVPQGPLALNYFSSVVSVSFSVFDPFIPPVDQTDRIRGVAYFYIGMKKEREGDDKSNGQSLKTSQDLADDFIASLGSCFSQSAKKSRWLAAINRLESDSNFADMSLGELASIEDIETTKKVARSLFSRMSSGHSIVLLTITKLIDTVEEKTLVLIDEPESHLHPPLLSAFIRALSDLLHNRNGMAIIATHSPVVLQEVPRLCVWKLTRLRNQGRSDRPERETFGENVSALTHEVFGLEVAKSGFHEMMQQDVSNGGTFDSILQKYTNQLGFEAQAILQVLIAARDANLAVASQQ